MKHIFGLMKKSVHEKRCKNLHSWIDHYCEMNKKHCEELEETKKKLELENRRAAFWKMKYLEPDKDPVVIGSKEDIEYITR